LGGQFAVHGRSLAEAVALIESSNRRADESIGQRRTAIEEVAAGLDSRTSDIEQRLQRFAALLDESLQGATDRARDIARIVAESSAQSMQAMQSERQRTSEELTKIYADHNSEASSMFTETTQRFNDALVGTTQRFTETLVGIKEMTSQMQNELEAT